MTCKTNSPLPLDVEAGQTYGWCTCGFSQTMPLCDRSHRELSDKKSFKFVAEETTRLYLCGCSETTTPPFCDNHDCKQGQNDGN